MDRFLLDDDDLATLEAARVLLRRLRSARTGEDRKDEALASLAAAVASAESTAGFDTSIDATRYGNVQLTFTPDSGRPFVLQVSCVTGQLAHPYGRTSDGPEVELVTWLQSALRTPEAIAALLVLRRAELRRRTAATADRGVDVLDSVLERQVQLRAVDARMGGATDRAALLETLAADFAGDELSLVAVADELLGSAPAG